MTQLALLPTMRGQQTHEIQDEAMTVLSIMQHHDAITGTHPQLVSRSYSKMMNDAVSRTSPTISRQLRYLAKQMGYSISELHICNAEYAREGTLTCADELQYYDGPFSLVVYNPNLEAI